MKMAKLYEATGALVAGMDKKKAARQAASVASAVANGNGAPHVRVVARVVAHTLTAIGNPQADGAAAVTPAPGSGSGAGPAAEPAAGWEQAVRAVQKLRQARSGAQTAARENSPDTDAALVAERRASAEPASMNWAEAQNEPQPRAYPSAAPESSPPVRQAIRGSLAGDFDTANIGAYAFSLYRSNYNVQLQVNALRQSGNVGGQFSLSGIPDDAWRHLRDRGNRPLPVWVLLHDFVVEVQVDDGPADAPVLYPTDMLPKDG
jgi:hypothetical protein